MKSSRNGWVLAAALVLGAAGAGRVEAQPTAAAAQELRVEVDGGYSPARVEAVAGRPVHITFFRRDRGPCTREVVFPTLNVRQTLTTGQATVITLPALTAGDYEFRCGMNMLRGTLHVTAAR